MGISERREREKIERHKAILNCARELILQKGAQHTSMEEIAKKAELSKATVYLYFSGKDALFNEICEEAARVFLTHLEPYFEKSITGMAALKYFWRGYFELFGNFEDMIIISRVRNIISPGIPIVSLEEESKSPNVDAILGIMQNIIEQCKTEGVFDPDLDSGLATRLLLSMFSFLINKAANLSPEGRKSSEVIKQMKIEMENAFQILIRGFAKEGIGRDILDITDN